MKALLLPILLLAALPLRGALSSATGDRLTDYHNWFAGFDPASDGISIPTLSPTLGLPTAGSTMQRSWSGWNPGWGFASLGRKPLRNDAPFGPLFVEVVFLGETSAYLNDWGYTLNGVPYLFTEGVQAATETPNLAFGDYTMFLLQPGETLDFWMRSMPMRPVEGAPADGAESALYHVFDSTKDVPAMGGPLYYWGIDVPLTAERPDEDRPFLVVSFEEDLGVDHDFDDLVFAIRAWYDPPCCGPIPEPATYGYYAAALLLCVGIERAVGRRRGGADTRDTSA